MRARNAFVAMAIAATLSACTGDGDGDASDPMTEITVDCAEFEDTTRKIADAQAQLYTGEGGTEAIETLDAELEALEEDAPDDVDTALQNMRDGFKQAEELLADPTGANKSELAELAPQLAEDSQTITEYIKDECG